MLPLPGKTTSIAILENTQIITIKIDCVFYKSKRRGTLWIQKLSWKKILFFVPLHRIKFPIKETILSGIFPWMVQY